MRYPHQNLIYYFIALGLNSNDIKDTLAIWDLPFDVDDYDSTLTEFILDIPDIESSYLSSFSDYISGNISMPYFNYEDWMGDFGFDVLVNPELDDIKYSIEQILFFPNIRDSVELLLYMGDDYSSILSKLSYKTADLIDEVIIEKYKMLIWNTDNMSVKDWASYSKLQMQLFPNKSPIFYKVKQDSAHALEADMGLAPEVDSVHLLKESCAMLYSKFKKTFDADTTDPKQLELGIKLHKAMLNTLSMIDAKEITNANDLSSIIQENFERQQFDSNNVVEQLDLFDSI